jgi:hypothetical protein
VQKAERLGDIDVQDIKLSMNELAMYMNNKGDDATFRNNIFLFQLICMFKVLYVAYKENNLSKYDAARLFMAPLLVLPAMNHTNYAAILCREIPLVRFRMLEEVREQLVAEAFGFFRSTD